MGAIGRYRYWLTKEGLTKVGGWAMDGLTNKQIASKIGISHQTLYEWMNKYPEFADTLKKNKEVVDRKVENALLKRALGYEYKEEIKMVSDNGKKSIKIVTKHVPPDVTAGIFWLKNRKPKEWRDVNKIELDNKTPIVSTNAEINLSELTKDEILKLTEKAFSDEK